MEGHTNQDETKRIPVKGSVKIVTNPQGQKWIDISEGNDPFSISLNLAYNDVLKEPLKKSDREQGNYSITLMRVAQAVWNAYQSVVDEKYLSDVMMPDLKKVLERQQKIEQERQKIEQEFSQSYKRMQQEMKRPQLSKYIERAATAKDKSSEDIDWLIVIGFALGCVYPLFFVFGKIEGANVGCMINIVVFVIAIVVFWSYASEPNDASSYYFHGEDIFWPVIGRFSKGFFIPIIITGIIHLIYIKFDK